MKDDKDLLRQQVKSIVDTLENPPEHYCSECDCEVNEDAVVCPDCGEYVGTMSGFDYIRDALDIEYIINSDRSFKGARILVCFGGPNIWINTATDTVEGYWWGDTCHMSYKDNIEIHEAAAELYACG